MQPQPPLRESNTTHQVQVQTCIKSTGFFGIQCTGPNPQPKAPTSSLPLPRSVVEQVVDVAAAVEDAHQLVPGRLHTPVASGG